MGDADVEKAYMDRKKKLRELHKKLSSPDSKRVQEIYHKLMGSNDADSEKSKSDEE